MDAERREKGLLKTSKRASIVIFSYCAIFLPTVSPTSARSRVVPSIGGVQGLGGFGGRGCCADLDVPPIERVESA